MNQIPGPILLLGMPLAAAAVTYVLRRWSLLAAVVSALTTAALAMLCIRLPLDGPAFLLGREVGFGRPVVIVGRNLVLDPAGQAFLAFLFAVATVFYLASWRPSQGRSFYPFSLAVLSLYVGVVLLEPFSLAILVFAMATTPAVFITQAGQPGSVRGAQRYLLATLLAVPLLLAANWLAGRPLLDADGAQLVRMAALPAALGFGLLFAIFPFGTWMPALAADAPPLTSGFVFIGGQTMAVFLALRFLGDAPWLLTDPATFKLAQVTGLAMVAAGALMAAVQRDFGRLFGYAALSDGGYLLLAFASGSGQGLVLTLMHLVGRSVSIALLAVSLAVLRHRAGGDSFARLGGTARRLPLVAAGLLLGGLGLAGIPVSAGFPTHWAVIRALSVDHWNWGVILLGSTAAIAIGVVRGLGSMMGDEPRDEVAGQPLVGWLVILLLGALAVGLGLFPQLLLEPIERIVPAFSLY